MIPRSLPRISSLSGGALVGGADGPADPRAVTRVVTDSRKAGPGALFVAIAGERTDGHAHVGQVASAGGSSAGADAEPSTGAAAGSAIRNWLVPT